MGDEERHRRKSSTNLYRNMTVSKALAVLKISEREFRELSDLEFRTAFTRRNSVSTGLSLHQDASSVGDRERNGEEYLDKYDDDDYDIFSIIGSAGDDIIII